VFGLDPIWLKLFDLGLESFISNDSPLCLCVLFVFDIDLGLVAYFFPGDDILVDDGADDENDGLGFDDDENDDDPCVVICC